MFVLPSERFTLTLKVVTLTLHCKHPQCHDQDNCKNHFFCEIHKKQSQQKFYLNFLAIFSCLFRCFRIGKPCQHAKREQKKKADSRLSCSSSGGQKAGHKIIYGFFLPDGTHMTPIANDILLNTFQEAVQDFLKDPSLKLYDAASA